MFNYLTLKTSGKSLLTRGSSAYLSLLAVVMILVAVAEAIAWGYLGSTFTPNNPYLGAAGLGAFVFILIYFLDRSLLTYDTLEEYHAKTFSYFKLDKSNKLSKIKMLLFKSTGFVIRLLIVSISIYITTPLLAQLVFKADIDNYSQALNQEALAAKKESLISELNSFKATQANKMQIIDNILLEEQSGKYGSVGFGAKAKALQTQKELNEARLLEVEKEFASKMQKLEIAFKNKDTNTLKSYGILLQVDSPMVRNEAIKVFETKDSYKQTHYAILALILMLTIAMFTLKLFSPKSVKLYFSQTLQEQWILYCNKYFDDKLPKKLKSTENDNTKLALPQMFENMMINYFNNQNTYKKDIENDLIENQSKEILDKAAQEFAEKQAKKLQNIQEAEEAKKALPEKRKSLIILKEKMAAINVSLEQNEKTLKNELILKEQLNELKLNHELVNYDINQLEQFTL